MKYSITINQALMIKYNLNVNQWCILDVISSSHTWCDTEIENNEVYYWIARQKIASELKALNLKADTIYRHIKKLAELGFLEHIKQGKKDLIRLTAKGKNLFTNTMSETNPNNDEKNSEINPTYNNTNNTKEQVFYDEYVSLWNNFATKNGKPKVAKLSHTRKNKIKLRKAEYKNLEAIFEYVLKKAENSTFLLKGKFFTFDWLFENDNNILKVYEGKYDNAQPEEVIL